MATPDETRESIILDHLPQVRLIARRMAPRIHSSVALEEIEAAGMLGLMMAAKTWTPERGIKLNTFAERRIRGAILDMLRGEEWASRQRRKKAKAIAAARSRAEHAAGGAADAEQVAAELGVSLEEFYRLTAHVHGINLKSLEDKAPALDTMRPKRIAELVPDCEEHGPQWAIESERAAGLIRQAVMRLPAKERRVIELCFYEGLRSTDVAESLGVSIARVSEVKRKAIGHLRQSIAPIWPRRGDPVAAKAA